LVGIVILVAPSIDRVSVSCGAIYVDESLCLDLAAEPPFANKAWVVGINLE
jgi:hypothetical protein